MRLSRISIHSADTCGGLLDGLVVSLRRPEREERRSFDPLCLIGPNGAGKSQLLQVTAEAFQIAWHVCRRTEERIATNPSLRFTLEYSLQEGGSSVDVRLSRTGEEAEPRLFTSRDGEWLERDLRAEGADLLPSIVVGYTSGENETLSLPFLASRSAYADEVASNAKHGLKHQDAPEPRLMLVDYATHFEVLLANLLLGDDHVRRELLKAANLDDISSFRCVIQLAHGAAPTASKETKKLTGRAKQVELTEELDLAIQGLQRAATTWSHDAKTNSYTLDFFVDEATRIAFKHFFSNALSLYRTLHKISMLNDLALSAEARKRMSKALGERHFASRLPEPPDDDKIFRLEQVTFRARDSEVDYASLSDGEHQLAQILGVFAMVDHRNALFLLDEPESHFNPQWRVKFAERMGHVRQASPSLGEQDVLLTTHAPFLPSDLHRESVRIFRRDEPGQLRASMPEEETFGASFDRILDVCFGISPPISDLAKDAIDDMFKITNPGELQEAISTLGDSNRKALLVGRLAKLRAAG